MYIHIYIYAHTFFFLIFIYLAVLGLSCGTRAYLLNGMWDLPGPGIEPMFPALTGGFLTSVPPGKSLLLFVIFTSLLYFLDSTYK